MDGHPLYEVKADLFRGLAHPLRVRILELVCEADEVPVSALLDDTGLKAPHLSQHLAVLRRYGLVTSTRRGSQVFCSAAHPSVAGLLTAARAVLASTAATRASLADALDADISRTTRSSSPRP